MMATTCNPSTSEGEARVSEVQGQPQQHSKFKANLGYRSSCLKQSNTYIHVYRLFKKIHNNFDLSVVPQLTPLCKYCFSLF